MSIEKSLSLALGLVLLAAPLTSANATGRLIQLDEGLRQQLEVLTIRGIIQLDTSTWPISAEAIDAALNAAQPANPQDSQQLDNIKAQLATNHVANVALVSNINGDDRPVFSSFDKDYNTVTPLGVTVGHRATTEHFDYAIQATANANDDRPSKQENLDGSYIGTKLGNHRLAFGSIPVWWGAGIDGSLIRSNAARPVTGILLQRAEDTPSRLPVLSYLGKVNYQITAGQLQDYHAVPDTKLIGMRLSIQPHRALQLGVSRTLMWGGEGRDETLTSLGKALIGTYDNGGEDKDPSNQLAGADIQVNLQPLFHVPVSVYGQLSGEDESGGLPSKYAYLAGIKGTAVVQNQPWLWHVEWANTHVDLDQDNITYRHSVYQDGYYQHGLALGHPIGGDGEIISVGLSGAINDTSDLRLTYAHTKANTSNQTINSAFPHKQNLDIVEVNWNYHYNPNQTFGLGGWGAHDSIGNRNEFGGTINYRYHF